MNGLTETAAATLADLALGHVTQTYPHKLDHVLQGPFDLDRPDALHPLFHGSFDWHSCVHAYWLLARLLRRFPNMAPALAIRDLFARQIVPANVAGELAYFERPWSRAFERPYGWAWLLKLAHELGRHENTSWADTMAPLAQCITLRFATFLPLSTYPIRAGTHGNTAFALLLAADHAGRKRGQSTLLRDTAIGWYGGDRDCQAWEPGGDDFLSPALIEAACMRRLLPREAFLSWFARFLPRLVHGEPTTLFRPAIVSDRADGKLAHLDGLNLSRAWCWRLIATALDVTDPRRALALEAADLHLAAGLPQINGDYMGEHWLATFALLALDS